MENKEGYSQKIDNRHIIERLSRLRKEEVWNATYSDALDDLHGKGYFITVEPFESKATRTGIAWFSKFTKVEETGNVYVHESPDTYRSWKDAIDAALIYALDNSITREDHENNQNELPVTCPPTDKRRSDSIPDENHKYATEFYGRHTTDDPFPFE